MTNAVAHELEKAGIDDVLCRVLIRAARWLIRQDQRAAVRIFTGDIGIDADVMPRHARDEGTLRRDGPSLDVRLEKIGVLAHEPRGVEIARPCHELGGT